MVGLPNALGRLTVCPRSVDDANEAGYTGPQPPVDGNSVKYRSKSHRLIKETEVVVMKLGDVKSPDWRSRQRRSRFGIHAVPGEASEGEGGRDFGNY